MRTQWWKACLAVLLFIGPVAEAHSPRRRPDRIQVPLPDPGRPAPVPSATGWTASALRLLGWDEAKILRVTGATGVATTPPHPFVVDLDDSNVEATFAASDEDTVWAILVMADDQASTLYADSWNQVADNSTLAAGPIPPRPREDSPVIKQLSKDDPGLLPANLRLGRVDYKAYSDLILTKWLIFKAPVIVIATRRGDELRFFPSGSISPAPIKLANVLRTEAWRRRAPWSGSFSPDGPWAIVPVVLGRFFDWFHRRTENVPTWVMMIASTLVAATMFQWMHPSEHSAPAPKTRPVTTQGVRAPARDGSSGSTTALERTAGGSRRRGGGAPSSAAKRGRGR